VWLATRPGHIGEWSQAGSLLSFSTGGAAPGGGGTGAGGGVREGRREGGEGMSPGDCLCRLL
jgi:hypothetical protein